MFERIRMWAEAMQRRFSRWRARRHASAAGRFQTSVVADRLGPELRRMLAPLALVVLATGSAFVLVRHPPVQGVGRGEVGIRINSFSGATTEWSEGSVLVWPAVHRLRVLSLRDQSWRATQMSRADGPAPLQSVEGLSVGADLTVRYAVDPLKAAAMAKSLPENIAADLVEPAAQGVVYKVFARYTVREIFSTKRAEIQQAIEAELKPRLAADGLLLRAVQIGKVDLPADYRRGMETLLAEELATEKMRYTLDLKDKRVRETELDARAEKVRREIGAEAAGREQVIAAKAQEEAMKHVLPFKQRQIEQRQLEAEAAKVTRIKAAEASAQSRRIEAGGEAEARQKLVDAEAYRMDKVGRAGAEQMSREGSLLTRHPLLIQKTLADKLSDKIQVIIAAPPSDGGFIGASLLGTPKRVEVAAGADEEQHAASTTTKEAP
ncbi:MAG TPA: SPFH domain-containing protein [Caldimonas sp.]|jgi:regulator of protease activity HflC (stomatin/prohibitin superfamily)|nr:SPFH domain-containing protein [Caldimonas sp.]HEX2543164.1 SPFH domain-containing protein [Caldimonas sp.]